MITTKMHFTTWVLTTAILLAETASAKAIYFPTHALRFRSSHEDIMQRTAFRYEGELDRRSLSSSPSLSITSSNSTMNTTVTTACTTAISAMTNITNAAGFAGCYNILTWDPTMSLFQADLRIYQPGVATGDFANISANQITIMLSYPDNTQFKSMVKRSTIEMVERDGETVQIQQYSLAGNFKQKMDVSKLNQTMIASLMVPQISLQTTSSTGLVTTNMTASDSAWFVAGQFTGVAANAAQIVNPSTAAAAITAAKGFVIPGQTFGIFPTGLIVTSVWTLLFFVAFGLGTAGRLKSRDVYRKRIIGLAARGKR